MADSANSSEGRRVPPDGTAWREAQQQVTDRNNEARQAGRKQREERERRLAALQHARDVRGGVAR
jgi:hypothetical protein